MIYNILKYVVIISQFSFIVSYNCGENGCGYEKHTIINKTEHGCFFNDTYCDYSGLDPVPAIYNISLILRCNDYYDGNITIQQAKYSRPLFSDTIDRQCDFVQCFGDNFTFCRWDNETCFQTATEETVAGWQYECMEQSVCVLQDISAQSMQEGRCGCGTGCPCLLRTLNIDYSCTYCEFYLISYYLPAIININTGI